MTRSVMVLVLLSATIGCSTVESNANDGELDARLTERTLFLANNSGTTLYYSVEWFPPLPNALYAQPRPCIDPAACPSLAAGARLVLNRPTTYDGIAPGEADYPEQVSVGYYRLVPGESATGFVREGVRAVTLRR